MLDHGGEGVAQLHLMAVDDLVSRIENLLQGGIQKTKAGYIGGGGHFFQRDFLPVVLVEGSDDVSQHFRTVIPDVILRMNEAFQKKTYDLKLLPLGQIGGVFFKDPKVFPEVFPVPKRPCFLQQCIHAELISKHMHDFDVVVDGMILKPVNDLIAEADGRLFQGPDGSAGLQDFPVLFFTRDGDFHAQTLQVVLEVFQFRIDSFISSLLGLIHIVQFLQNHMEGFIQGIDVHGLHIVYLFVFHPEVRVDEKESFQREILKLQIPGAVIDSDVSDVVNAMFLKPKI